MCLFEMILQLFGGRGKGGSGGGGNGGVGFQQLSKELAQEIVDQNHFKYERESIKEIKDLFLKIAQTKNGIYVNDDGDILVKKTITKEAQKLAEKLADRIEFVDQDIKDAYDELRSRTRGKYRIDPQGEFDHFREYQKNSPIKVVVGENAKDPKTGKIRRTLEVDSLYSELYNNGANRWGLKNPSGSAAKLRELNDTLRNLKASSRYGIYSDRAKSEIGSPSQVIRGIRDSLIMDAGMAQTAYIKKSSGKGRKK